MDSLNRVDAQNRMYTYLDRVEGNHQTDHITVASVRCINAA